MISLVTGTIGLSVAALIIFLMRRDRLHVKHGLGWVGVTIGFALLGFSPVITDQAAQLLGVAYPPVLALTLGVALLVIKALMLDIEISRIELRNQRLVQRVAMLETDLQALQTKLEGDHTTPSEQDAPRRLTMHERNHHTRSTGTCFASP